MSQSFDISTSYDALDDTVYDIFDVDAYCSSLSPPVSTPESVPHATTSTSRLKRYPKTCGHPRPSPADIPSPVVTTATTVASTLSVPTATGAKPGKPDKGKGRQRPAIAAPPSSPVDASLPAPSAESAASVELAPEQHVCPVRMLKRLDEWFAQGWEPGVDKSRLQNMAEIFNSAEAVVEGSLSNIRHTDLAWRLADSKGWEKSAGSSIMGAIDIQVTVTKILYKDCGESLIASFHSFLGQKEVELGNSGRLASVPGPSLQKETG